MGMSPCAVIKMMGICLPVSVNRRWKSRPLICGSRTTCERFSAKANGLDKVMDRLTQTTVVVDDEYRGKRFRRHARASTLVGRLKQKVAPGPILEVAQTRPPCASTIDRVIAKPIPVPCGFVVWNASKICSALSVGNPTPVSLIEMVN